MDNITLFYVSLGAIVGFLLAIVILLNKILNILRQMNNGEPTPGETKKLKMTNFKLK